MPLQDTDPTPSFGGFGLTGRMSDALERMLLSGGGSDAAQQRERFDALEQRITE